MLARSAGTYSLPSAQWLQQASRSRRRRQPRMPGIGYLRRPGRYPHLARRPYHPRTADSVRRGRNVVRNTEMAEGEARNGSTLLRRTGALKMMSSGRSPQHRPWPPRKRPRNPMSRPLPYRSGTDGMYASLAPSLGGNVTGVRPRAELVGKLPRNAQAAIPGVDRVDVICQPVHTGTTEKTC